MKNDEAGVATLEILIALAVIALSISAVIMVVFGNQSLSVDAQTTQEALYKAQAGLEEARASTHNNWDNIVSNSTTEEIFTKNTSVADVDEFVKLVNVVVNWQIQQPRSVELSTLLTDWQSALAQGSCATVSQGNWSAPALSTTIDLGATGPATAVDVKHGIAYVTANGDSTKNDFFAIDVSTGIPTILSKFSTGPGLTAVHVAGNFAYLGNTSTAAQLQIVDITNPSAAYLRKNFKLPGSNSGDTATSLYYYNHNIYLGTPKSSIAEFHIIDVSNVDNPKEVGTWEFNTSVNAIYVSNGLAYVATPDDEELKILDVHDPAKIKLVGGYNAPGGSGNGKSFVRTGLRLYLGRTVGNDELYVLHIGNINPDALASANINSTVNGLVSMGNLVFLSTTDSAMEFQVWQLSENESAFTKLSQLDLPAKATFIDCEGQTIYLTNEDPSKGLMIIASN